MKRWFFLPPPLRQAALGVTLLSALLCLLPGTSFAYTESQTQNQTTDGQDFTFNFTSLPRAQAATTVTVSVRVYGNYGGATEFAAVTIDGLTQVQHGGGADCAAGGNNQDYTVVGTLLNDNALTVNVNLSNDVSATQCSNYQERVVVTVNYQERATDLTVTSATVGVSGGTVGAGSTVSVNYTVRNNGEPVKNDFDVRFFYCRQNNDTTCTVITTTTISDDFSGNQSRTYAQSLTLPNTVVNGTGYIRVLVDQKDDIEEGNNESNNNRWGSFQVTAFPDLQVTALTLNPNSDVYAGGPTEVTFEITNAGDAQARGFVVGFVYSADNTLDTGDTALQATQPIASLDAGAKTTPTKITLTIPPGATAGSTAYIFAYVDPPNIAGGGATGNVTECTTSGCTQETNNTRSASFTIANKPDLDVSAASFTATAPVGAGRTRELTFSLRARAMAVTTDFQVSFYYCRQDNDTNCTQIGTARDISDDFTLNQVRQYTQNLTLPNTVVFGAGHIRVFVDSEGNDVDEINENNNNRYVQFNVTERPDLQVEVITVAPSTQLPGGNLTVNYRIRNAGRARAENFMVRFGYATTNNGTPSTTFKSDVTIASLDANASSPSATGTSTTTVQVDTGATPAATAYIVGWADFDDTVTECTPANCAQETNNRNSASFTVTDSNPDLDITAATLNPTTVTGSGASTTLSFTIRNRNKAVTTDFDVNFYICNADNDTTNCTQIGSSRTITDDFAPLQTRNYTQSLTLPNTVTGSGFIRVFIDSGAAVTETDETNNNDWVALTVSGQVDIVAAFATPTPNNQLPGQNISVAYRVRNDGSIATSGRYKIRMYFSTDNAFDSNDTLLLSFDRAALQAGATQNGTRTITIPSSLSPGAGFILMFVDHDDIYSESDENNNVSSAAFTVNGTMPEPMGEMPPADAAPDTPPSEPMGEMTSSEPMGELPPEPPPSEPTTDGGAGELPPEPPPGEPPPTETRPDAGPDTPPSEPMGEMTSSEPTGEMPPTEMAGETTPSESTGETTPSEPTGETTPGDAGATDAMPGEQMPDGDNCFVNPCPSGKVCANNVCIDDPCLNVTCNADEVCKAGTCEKICDCLQCPGGQKCQAGVCVTDPCAGVNCPVGEICNPATGMCADFKCPAITCGPGYTCVTDTCIEDPCNNLKCPANTQCRGGQCVGSNCSERTTENTGEGITEAGGETTGDAGEMTDAGEQTGDAGEQTGDAGEPTADADEPTPDPGTPDPGTPDPGTPDPGTPDDGTPDPGSNTEQTTTTDSTADGGGSDTAVQDNTSGNDNGGSGNDNAQVTGGCCQIGQAQQLPFGTILLLMLFLLLPSMRRRRS